MRIPLKIFVSVLLLILAVAVGTEVVALHRIKLSPPTPGTPPQPVVVRKDTHEPTPPKLVRPLPGHVPARLAGQRR